MAPITTHACAMYSRAAIFDHLTPRSLSPLIFDLETLNLGLALDLALQPSSTGTGWHRKLLSLQSSSSQFMRSLYLSVRPSYNLRSCLISSVKLSKSFEFIAQNACKIIRRDGGINKRLGTNPLPSNRPCMFQDCVTSFIYRDKFYFLTSFIHLYLQREYS